MRNIIILLIASAILYILPYSLTADPYSEPVNPFEATRSTGVDSLNMHFIGMWNFGYPYAICTDDDHIYLDSGGSVIIFDVSDIINPQKIGYISFPGNFVHGIYVLDTLMFVGDREKGFRIANVSNPAFPIEVGSYESYLSCAVFARRNLAYVLEESKDPLAVGELTIYDVTNPQEPTILAKDTLPKVHLADIVVKDNYAYVANGQGGLRIIDVSDSTNPFETGYYIPPFSAYARSISICNDTLLLLGVEGTYQNGGLWLINIKDPYVPYLMGCDTSFYRGFDVSHYSHFAYVSAISSGIKIIDFIDPLNPYVIGEFIPPTYLWNLVHANIGPYIYAGELRDNGLRTIDASNPNLPITVDYDIIPDECRDVEVNGDYAYVANDASGIFILDVSDPSNPEEISNYNTPERANSIIVRDSIAYVADSTAIIILNVKDPSQPEWLSELPLACDGYGMALNFPYLYVTSVMEHKMAIVDVSNPAIPFITGTCTVDENFPTYICYKDSFAFISTPPQGLAVINVANAYNPSLITYLPLSIWGRGLDYRGNYLYIADFLINFICIVDISTPSIPVLVDSFTTIRPYPFELAIRDSFLYAALQRAGIEVFNISSPLSPQSVGYYYGSPLSIPLGIDVENSLAYLAANNGIFIFRHTGAGGKKEIDNRGYERDLSFRFHPNPFSSEVRIQISGIRRQKSENRERNSLRIYDVSGRAVRHFILYPSSFILGVTWDGRDEAGKVLPPGIYFLKLTAGEYTETKKIIKIR